MENWILFYQTWIVLGIIFTLLELADGSNIFFLPLGVGALFVNLYLYLSEQGLLTNFLILESWYQVLAIWAVLSVVVSILIAKFWNKKSDANDDDINNY
jgi:membrane protein implicated in regulation of membrane protease activity